MLKKLFKKKDGEETVELLQEYNKMTVGWVWDTLLLAHMLGTYEVHYKIGGYSIEEDGICVSIDHWHTRYYSLNISIKESGLDDLVVCKKSSSRRGDVFEWIHQGSWVDLTIKMLEDIEQKNKFALEQEALRKEKELQDRLERYEKKYRLPSIFK